MESPHCHDPYYRPSINTTSTKNTLKYSYPTIFELATLITAVSTSTSTPPALLHHQHYKYHTLKQHHNIITNITNHWFYNQQGKKAIQLLSYSSNKVLSQLWKGIFRPKSKCPMSWLFLLKSYMFFLAKWFILSPSIRCGGSRKKIFT